MVELLQTVSELLQRLSNVNWSFAEVVAVMALILVGLAMLVLLKKGR